MSAFDVTGAVMTCLRCDTWQIDAPPRARASLGVDGVATAIGEAVHEHQLDAHADEAHTPVSFRGRPLSMASGNAATGGCAGYALPRWWDWVTVRGTR